jgi:hypothetical protein
MKLKKSHFFYVAEFSLLQLHAKEKIQQHSKEKENTIETKKIFSFSGDLRLLHQYKHLLKLQKLKPGLHL